MCFANQRHHQCCFAHSHTTAPGENPQLLQQKVRLQSVKPRCPATSAWRASASHNLPRSPDSSWGGIAKSCYLKKISHSWWMDVSSPKYGKKCFWMFLTKKHMKIKDMHSNTIEFYNNTHTINVLSNAETCPAQVCQSLTLNMFYPRNSLPLPSWI